MRFRSWIQSAAVVLPLSLAAALAWRLPRLADRPMHGDEANQAVRTGLLMDERVYRYDPTDHHGPVLYFAALPFCRATAGDFAGTTEWNFRLVPVAFSLLTLVLMAWMGRGGGGLFLHPGGLAAALLLTACSPAMVYYNRFFIQESMLVTFLTGMFACGLGWSRAAAGSRARAAWAAGLGAFAGLAAASKETAVLSFAAAAAAAFAAFGWRRIRGGLSRRDIAWAAGAMLFVAAFFFSSFFTHPRGIYDAVVSAAPAYFRRATAVPEHQHAWPFYLQILFWFRYGRGPVWSEAGILLPALLAAAAAWLPAPSGPGPRRRAIRFLSVYTLALTALYSAIPYKTPWCALSFLHGWLMLAGIGIGGLFRWAAERIPPARRGARAAAGAAVCALLAALLARSCIQACRACFRYPADPRNPYVYAHTGADALNLIRAVREAAGRDRGPDTPIAVAAPPADTWPLPWYFRAFRNVGYWTRVEDIPGEFDPAVLIVSADQGDAAGRRFGRGKQAAFYGIRPGALLLLFVPAPAEPAGGHGVPPPQ